VNISISSNLIYWILLLQPMYLCCMGAGARRHFCCQ
jgi:hypothetical protein